MTQRSYDPQAIRPIDATASSGLPRGLLRLLALLALAVLAAGLAFAQEDDVVIEYGDTTVTKSEFEADFAVAARTTLVQQGMEPTEENLATFEANKAEFLDQLATQLVLFEEAQDRDLTAGDEEVDTLLEDFRAAHDSEEAFVEYIGTLGFADEAQLRSHLREALTIQALIDDIAADIDVSSSEVEDWYEANPEQFETEAGTAPLEDVREDIERFLVQQEVDVRLQELRAESNVQVFPENL